MACVAFSSIEDKGSKPMTNILENNFLVGENRPGLDSEIQRKARHDGEGSSRRGEPIHKLAPWFNNAQALATYIKKWERRPFVAPRYISYNFLVRNQYRRIIDVMEVQGFDTLVSMQNDYYPDLVSACMSHLKYSPSNEGGYIECYIGGRFRVVPLNAIANLCGLPMEGHRFSGGIRAHESWGPYAFQRGLNAIGYNEQVIGRERPSVHKLPTEMRILHYLLTYTLLPRGGNHMAFSNMMMFFLCGQCWKYLGVNVTGHRKLQVDDRSCINESTIKYMRQQIEQPGQGVDEVEEEIDRMKEEEAQAQGAQIPPQEAQAQPSMFDLVQEMRNMNQNFQAFQMDDRLGRVEENVCIIHDYIGIPNQDEE
ncbi:hypothetical protein PIB30_066009 [Stylosanthes scabra]|uniref:Uncharacterized protein n=1 Tax=Stylosanthes scabra TaxID=79078 RepID=A0ABU6VKI0_9FABA|nr:hypothetical protein [Stylosanthes scabra]